MQIVKWGIIAPGNIAGTFTRALKEVDGAQRHSVYSRSLERAQHFCAEHEFTYSYAQLEDFLSDPELDAVYIASPHSEHHAQSIAALNAGKAVLCEKPMTVNAQQANEVLAAAQSTNSFYMEAVWTRCLPVYQHIKKWVAAGEIGQVKMLHASFAFNRPFDPRSRLYAPERAGGALLDVGIYPLTLCDIVMQQLPTQVLALAELAPTQVDQNIAMVLKYADGALANLSAGIGVQTNHGAYIYGDEGHIHINPGFWCSQSAQVYANGAGEPHLVCDAPHRVNGYEYEIEEVHRCLANQLYESPLVSHASSQRLMQIMDEVRRQVGVRYQWD